MLSGRRKALPQGFSRKSGLIPFLCKRLRSYRPDNKDVVYKDYDAEHIVDSSIWLKETLRVVRRYHSYLSITRK